MTDDQKDAATEIDDSTLDDVQAGSGRMQTAVSLDQSVPLNKVDLSAGAGVSPFRELRTALTRDDVDDGIGRVGANPTPHP